MGSMAASPAASLGFLFVTGNSIMAIRKSRGDAAAVSFVVVSYLTLLLLLYCLRWFETAHPGSASRDRARLGVWLTTTLLTALFTWRVARLMPWPVAAGVCFMGGSTVAGGFYALFLLPRAAEDSELMVENIQ
ncbi:unnamed protein product [Urochloa decumbens]|uniref:Uncharacterized protein n=1 Tax=Urochloa decumbens TaxID=240449 RepID=A0ABC9E5L3_9POAL